MKYQILAFGVLFAIWLSIVGTLIYIAMHFITKFW